MNLAPVPAPPSSIGYLVITASQREEWAEFLQDSLIVSEDNDSDKDFNSEEEDENAEDFAGNDYPEDEEGGDQDGDEGLDGPGFLDEDENAYSSRGDENQNLLWHRSAAAPRHVGRGYDEGEEFDEDDASWGSGADVPPAV